MLGLAYKPDVADDRESPAYHILSELLARGCDVRVYDPYVRCDHSVRSLEAALAGANATVLTTAHTEYIREADQLKTCGIVIDGRNCLDRDALVGAGVAYRGVGR